MKTKTAKELTPSRLLHMIQRGYGVDDAVVMTSASYREVGEMASHLAEAHAWMRPWAELALDRHYGGRSRAA